jgi:hypothetical protein
VTARHREEIEIFQKLWIATIEEIKLKKKKRKRFVVECELIKMIIRCQNKAVFRVRQDCPRMAVQSRNSSIDAIIEGSLLRRV